MTLTVSGDPSVCTLSNASSGSATVMLLGVGTCTITADQAGSTAYEAVPTVSRRFPVQPARLTVTAPSPSLTYGDPLPAITPGYSGFVYGETSSVLTTQAACTVSPNSGGAGTYPIGCKGAVDANYTFRYVPGTLTIGKAPLTVTANDKSMTYGAAVPIFDADYSGLANGDTRSVVNVTCGAVDGGNHPVSSRTPAGRYPITCSPGPNANYILTYHSGTLTITKAATSVTLASVPHSSVFGRPVTFTARVSVTSPGSEHPSGTVEFKDRGADIGGCSAQPVDTAALTATCTTSALTVATHNITAVYSGDSNFVGSSTASAVSQTVNKAASVVTTAPVTPVTQGQPASFTAVVTVTAPGAGTPEGTVTFYDGTTSLGAGRLVVMDGKDQAIFTTRGLAVGAHTITASYGGGDSFLTSTGAGLTQYINTNLSGHPKLSNGAYNLSNTYLVGGYFVNAPLAGTRLTNSNLTNAVFTAADLTGANLSDSSFKGASFSGADLSGATLTNSNLKGATGLTAATLSNVIWSNTTCPDGTVSNNDGGTCADHL